jgi:hypothetical protein
VCFQEIRGTRFTEQRLKNVAGDAKLWASQGVS